MVGAVMDWGSFQTWPHLFFMEKQMEKD